MHAAIATLLLVACPAAWAQPAPPTLATPPAPAPIAFKTVAEALSQLEARDGDDVIVTHAEGWVTVNEPAASAQWSFTPAGHYAHPAVVRRLILRQAGGAMSVDTQALCEVPAAQCDKLIAEFASMNDRILQALRSRGRQGSTRPQ